MQFKKKLFKSSRDLMKILDRYDIVYLILEELNEFCILSNQSGVLKFKKYSVFFPSLLEIKVSNGDFHSDATEVPFFKKLFFFSHCEEHLTTKNLLWNGKFFMEPLTPI